ncbi:response regulator transcription factor [Lutimaribacter sp. EGI FJ00015]|uniref:Response regulator transcription factor n=1 Tax=Lutimaribacter degradans TaxID=2945989 RepID=A0ACC5ZVA2_9RHOB|nr:response regulator transcription factor [Lutimaribacter sp. EGI FJ00013]MCM2562267.1 response regulator transcription factor [Lutimaribacter sp. EGI FJ00013]MCO0613422.1 response regulator transcription factor [Lutimaribacter sp. EGI FJ00015]MCO0636396.1 response regulator transcription factor [Lutimaribacter sp. EGI FJ00014]
MAKVLIADDHELVRSALASFLAESADFQISEAATLEQALTTIAAQGPFELVLLDYTMPGMSLPAGLTQTIRANAPGPVAILSGTAPPEVARRALAAGAQGFLPKTMAPDTMITALRHMIAGHVYRPQDFLDSEREKKAAIHITPREMDVLRGVMAGKSNKEIARDLDIQEVTIKLHVKTICRKLDARNRTHAAMLARDLALA